MHPEAILAIVAGSLVILAIVLVAVSRHRRRQLQKRFGPEYVRTVRHLGNLDQAETELAKRQARVEHLHLHPLEAADRTRFSDRWRRLQMRFVDDPQMAVTEADTLIGELMQARGYPVADFEQRAADVSVDHPIVVENYRTAHAIALRRRTGQGTTEDLRQAMVHYRLLFDELMGVTEAVAVEVRR